MPRYEDCDSCEGARDEITHLRAENERLRTALCTLANNFVEGWSKDTRHETIAAVECLARAALNG